MALLGFASWIFSHKGRLTGQLGPAEQQFQEMYQSPQTNIQQKHMKEAKNGDGAWSRGWRGTWGRNQTSRKLQSTQEQTKGNFYTLTGEEKALVKCCVLKNYNLKLSVVLSSSNSNYIYCKKERKCMCYFNLQMRIRFTKLQVANVHTELYTRGQAQQENFCNKRCWPH